VENSMDDLCGSIFTDNVHVLKQKIALRNKDIKMLFVLPSYVLGLKNCC